MVLIEGIEYTGDFTWCELCDNYVLGDHNFLRVHIAYIHGHAVLYSCDLCVHEESREYTLVSLHRHQYIYHRGSPYAVRAAVVKTVTTPLETLNNPPVGWPALPTRPCTPGDEDWNSEAERERTRYRMACKEYSARRVCDGPEVCSSSVVSEPTAVTHTQRIVTHTVVRSTERSDASNVSGFPSKRRKRS